MCTRTSQALFNLKKKASHQRILVEGTREEKALYLIEDKWVRWRP